MSVPTGAWAVGVSGGADSVALLSLLRSRSDLSLHVVHLDHQTRAGQSTQDAKFVSDLAAQWNLPGTIATRGQIEPLLASEIANRSARFRALRLALYRQVIEKHHLQGVILAHHADDQAETILHRLLRSASYAGVTGIKARAVVGGLTILRPLLAVTKRELQTYLVERGIGWREDASNASDEYLRNRLRKLLARQPELGRALLELMEACSQLRSWARQSAPALSEQIRIDELNRLPRVVAKESLRRWLLDRGMSAEDIDAGVIDRLLEMAGDAASAPRQDFPGEISIRRTSGEIYIEKSH